jgi:hypothetical protein
MRKTASTGEWNGFPEMAMRKDTHECEEMEVSILFHARVLGLSN